MPTTPDLDAVSDFRGRLPSRTYNACKTPPKNRDARRESFPVRKANPGGPPSTPNSEKLQRVSLDDPEHHHA